LDISAESAPAKVNLFLHVTGKRADGYHLLDSLAVFAAIEDEIAFAPADRLTFIPSPGPFAPSLAAEADKPGAARRPGPGGGIRYRATGALTLRKRIRVASGIGGGSADAAAALRLLNRAWRLRLDEEALTRIALGLGADVPVCLRNRASRMGGGRRPSGHGAIVTRPWAAVGQPGHPTFDRIGVRARAGGFSPEARLPAGWGDAAAMAALAVGADERPR